MAEILRRGAGARAGDAASRPRAWRRRAIGLGAGAAVAAVGLAACGGATSTGGSGGGVVTAKTPWATVNIGLALTPPKVIFLGPYVARAQGYFAKEHLHVNFIGMPNGLQTELGTTSGTIQFGLSSATDGIESAAANAPIHVIASYGTTLDTQCIGSRAIKSPKDLIGKPVGSTGTGGFSYTLLAACLIPDGVSPSQVRPINMTRAQFVGALATGQIDAAVFHADDAYVVTHKVPGAHVLVSEYKAIPQWWYGGITTLDSYAHSHRGVVERFLTAMVMADRWMNDRAHTHQLVQIGVRYTQEDPAAVRYAVNFLQTSGSWPNGLGLSRSQEEYTTKQLMKFKEITRMPSYSQVVDPSYMEAVLKRLGPA